MNGAAAALIGLYLVLLPFKGKDNVNAFVSALKQDADFVKWGVAVAILYALSQNDTTAPIAKPFVVLVFLAMSISGGAQLAPVLNQLTTWFKSFNPSQGLQ